MILILEAEWLAAPEGLQLIYGKINYPIQTLKNSKDFVFI
jgi:hypothetical protein